MRKFTIYVQQPHAPSPRFAYCSVMTSSPLRPQGSIRVKCVIVPFNDDASAFLVCEAPPTREEPGGYQTLLGGGVEFGESLQDAIVREVREELDTSICDLRYVGVLENRFQLDGAPGHEIVFVYAGRLDPEPPITGGTMTESDGTTAPVVWRPVNGGIPDLPLYPAGLQGLLSPVINRA